MKPNEIRNLSANEIQDEVNERRKRLLDLRIQASVGQLTDNSTIKKLKKEIARFLTILQEKRREAAA